MEISTFCVLAFTHTHHTYTHESSCSRKLLSIFCVSDSSNPRVHSSRAKRRVCEWLKWEKTFSRSLLISNTDSDFVRLLILAFDESVYTNTYTQRDLYLWIQFSWCCFSYCIWVLRNTGGPLWSFGHEGQWKSGTIKVFFPQHTSYVKVAMFPQNS